MKKLFILLSILIIGGVAAFVVMRNRDGEPMFRTEKARRGNIVSTVTATGTVNPVTTVLVGTQVSGMIKDIYVDFNSPVKKGQLIAQIDPSTFQAQVAQARANLLTAKANLDKARSTLADAKRTRGRQKKLLALNLVAQSDFDTADTNYETSLAQVSASVAQVSQSQAALRMAEINLKYTRIISPVNGTVVSRNVDVGQTVAASFQTPTLFNIARDLTKMQIDTSVDEADIGKVNVGQPVEFNVDAYPDITFKGRVLQVRNAPITVQNVVTYDVVIQVDNSDLKLKPGMTANISIIVSSRKDALSVPNSAFRFRLAGGKKPGGKQKNLGRGVWVLEQGKPVWVKAEPGISDGNYTEIVSGDLRDGQDVIVESLAREKPAARGPRMF